jgi:KDO2-lipid IV(A) lauroyltransferase
VVVLFVLRAARRMSLPATLVLGRTLGRLAFDIFRRARRMTIRNIGHAADASDHRSLRRTGVTAAERLGENMLAMARAQGGVMPQVLAEGLWTLDRALSAGCGAVVVSAHFGPWELLPITLAQAGYRVGLVTRTLRDPFVDAVMTRMRTRAGVRPFPRGTPVSTLVAWLRSGGVIGLVLDQRTRVQTAEATFMGRRAPTALGPAVLALRSGAPLLAGTVCRAVAPPCDLRAVFTALPPLARGSQPVDPESTTRALAHLVDAQLRRDPLQWVWFHDRYGLSRPSPCSPSA